MKLGLLGIDARIAEVVAAAARRGDTIVIGFDLPTAGPLAAVVDASVPRAASWESLLDAQVCDAVLVGGDGWSDARADAVRALVQAGRTLLLSHPLVLSMLWAYEIDMIRGDSRARLIPFLPDRQQPFVERLRRRIEAGLAGAGPLGSVEAIAMERRLPDRSRDAVLRAIAIDADLVRVLAGDPARLSTLGGADAESAWSTLSVGFSGPSQLPVRWQVVRGDRPGLRITLVQADGASVVDIPDVFRPGVDPARPDDDASGGWSWTDAGGPVETAHFDRGAALLDQLHGLQVLHGLQGGDGQATIPVGVWADAARAIELAETVPRSLAKGRAIDLHQEEFSELGTFRGTMASLGCGLVLATLFLLVLATLVGGIARAAGWEWGERIAGLWPQAALVVLGLFLAVQILPLLINATAVQNPRDEGEADGRPRHP